MRLAVCSLLPLIVACSDGVDGDFPINPGGGSGMFGSGSGTLPDAAPGDGASGSKRVCGLSEILAWQDCDMAGLEGLTVTVGTLSTMTLADGSFGIGTPTGANLVWRVSGPGRVPSLREYAGNNRIESITTALYEDLTAEGNIVIVDGAGTIFAQVIYMGQPLANVTATLPGLQDIVRYDDAGAAGSFSFDATHTSGIIWFPNVTPSATVTFTVTPPVDVGPPQDVMVRVDANTATFTTIDLTPPPPQ